MFKFPDEILQKLDEGVPSHKSDAKAAPTGREFLWPSQFLIFLGACYDDEGTWMRTPQLVKPDWIERIRYGFGEFARAGAFEIAVRSPQIVVDEKVTPDPAAGGWVHGYFRYVRKPPKIFETNPEFAARWMSAARKLRPYIEVVDTPPPVKRSTSTETEELRAWLNDVRQTYGVWCRFPRPVSRLVHVRIRSGTMYGARPGEFQVEGRARAGGEGQYERPELEIGTGKSWLFVLNKRWREGLPSKPPTSLDLVTPPPMTEAQIRANRRSKTRAGSEDLSLSDWLYYNVRWADKPHEWQILPWRAEKLPRHIVERIESGASFGGQEGEYDAMFRTVYDAYGRSDRQLWCRVNEDYLAEHPHYPYDVPVGKLSPEELVDELAEQRKKLERRLRHVKAPTAEKAVDEPETTADGLPIWK